MSMEGVTILKVDEPYLAIGGILLEGPSYDARKDELRWVDMGLDKVYFLNLSEGSKSLRTYTFAGNTVATLANIKDSDNLLLAGGKYGFCTFDTSSGELSQYLSYFGDELSPAECRRFRANDGAIDARGRILQGIMIDDKIEPTTPVGMLLSLNTQGKLTRVVEGIVCPNGLGWNAANTIMYWAESFSGNLYAFDYDIDTGSATNKRVIYHLHNENNTNVPDGLVVDEEDHVWLAIWGSSLIVRLSPTGEVVCKIELPTRFVTCPAFVGEDLFITTAAEREPKTYPESARFGGHMYRCHVGVRGLPKFEGADLASYLPRT